MVGTHKHSLATRQHQIASQFAAARKVQIRLPPPLKNQTPVGVLFYVVLARRGSLWVDFSLFPRCPFGTAALTASIFLKLFFKIIWPQAAPNMVGTHKHSLATRQHQIAMQFAAAREVQIRLPPHSCIDKIDKVKILVF